MGLFPEEQGGARRGSSKAPADILARSGLPVPELRSSEQSDVQLFNTDFRRLVARISKLISILSPTVQGQTEDQGTTILAPHAPQHENGGSDPINVTGLAGVLAQPQIPQAHDIQGPIHYAAGLVSGHVMRASGPAAFSFAPLQDGDIPASITRDSELAAAITASEEEAVKDFLWKVRKGDYPGLSVVVMRGNNPDVDSGAAEDLVPWGGTYLFEPSTYNVEVLSSSANDTLAGTGARTVTIDGLDAAWQPQSVTVNLNGVTAVPAGPLWRRINFARVASVGTQGFNAGTITVRIPGPGATQEQIQPNESASRSGIYTVPDGYAATLMLGTFTLRRSGNDSVDFGVIVHNPSTGIYILGEEYGLSGTGTSLVNVQLSRARFIGPYDVKLRALNPSSNNNGVGANLVMLLEDLP